MATHLLRGWVYILVGAATLLAFLWWVEHDQPQIPATQPEITSSSTPAPEEQPGPGTEPVAASTPSTEAASEASTDEPVVEGPLPETTGFQAESPEAEPASAVPAEVVNQTTKAVEKDPGPVGFCSPINGTNLREILEGGRPDGRNGIEIRIDNAAAVRAVVSGTVVRVFESPYTGTSLYLVDRNARFSFMYGRFESLARGIETGAFVGCGDVLGYMPVQGGSLNMAVRRIRWWESDPIPMDAIFEEE